MGTKISIQVNLGKGSLQKKFKKLQINAIFYIVCKRHRKVPTKIIRKACVL